MNRCGSIRCRDSRRNVSPGIDGHGESRTEGGGILHRLLREMEFFDSLGRQGETDQPTGVSGHEIDGLGRHVLGGNDKIAFILAIFIIDEDDKFSILNVSNGVFDAVKRSAHSFHVDCSMVNVQWTINLSFNIAHVTLFFRPTVKW
jgi:hypothetical protein